MVRQPKWVRWQPPDLGSFVLNTDGSVVNSGKAFAGGLVCDSDGSWVGRLYGLKRLRCLRIGEAVGQARVGSYFPTICLEPSVVVYSEGVCGVMERQSVCVAANIRAKQRG